MVKRLFYVWLSIGLLGVVALLWPNRGLISRARTIDLLRRAQAANEAAETLLNGDETRVDAAWKDALKCAVDGLARLPGGADREAVVELRFLRAQALHHDGQAPTALTELIQLEREFSGDAGSAISPDLKDAVKAESASVHYDLGWTLREQSSESVAWTGECDQAEASFRDLAERADPSRRAIYEANLARAIHFREAQSLVQNGLCFPSNTLRTPNCREQLDREMRKSNPPPPPSDREEDDTRKHLNDKGTQDAKSGNVGR